MEAVMADISERVREDWPAVLALITLLLGYVVLTIIDLDSLQPFGLPLLAAVAVFIVAEAARSLL